MQKTGKKRQKKKSRKNKSKSVFETQFVVAHENLENPNKYLVEKGYMVSSSSGGQLYHEEYDEHGVKIGTQCFT